MTSSFGVKPRPPDPKQFLQRGTREIREGARIPSVEHKNKDVIKPPVPSRDDKPVQGLKTSKDYVNCNAVEIINSTAKKRKEMEAPFTSRDGYGKVPAYLANVKAEIEHEKELVDMYVEEQYGSAKGCQEDQEVLDEGERRVLINQLKQRWGDVNAEYQKYCHKMIFDTPGERKRKVWI